MARLLAGKWVGAAERSDLGATLCSAFADSSRRALTAWLMTSVRRHAPLRPWGIDVLIGCNKGVNFGENVLMEPPLSLGQVYAILGDNRAPLDFVESGDRYRPIFAQCSDLIVVCAHANPPCFAAGIPRNAHAERAPADATCIQTKKRPTTQAVSYCGELSARIGIYSRSLVTYVVSLSLRRRYLDDGQWRIAAALPRLSPSCHTDEMAPGARRVQTDRRGDHGEERRRRGVRNEFEEGRSQTRSSGHALARDLRDAFPRRASQRKFAAANAQHENSVRKIGA
jgi:hypothetical protein